MRTGKVTVAAPEDDKPADPHAENSVKACDTGSPIAELKAKFSQVDFSHLDPVFPDKTSPAGARYHYTRPAILARAESAMRELYNRPEKAIIVVSHSGFLRLGVTTHYFFNADYRIFDFEVAAEGEPLQLKQWQSTKAGGLGWSWERTVKLGEGLPDPTAETPEETPKAPEA